MEETPGSIVPDEPLLRSLYDRQKLQDHTLAEMREKLDECMEEIAKLKGMQLSAPVAERHVENGWCIQDANDDDCQKGNNEKPAEGNSKIAIATYNFGESMWDAVVLLFFKDISYSEKFVLMVGFIINLGLQVALLLVINLDMLNNPYTEDRISEMMKWRVNNGHSDKNFDTVSGSSLTSRLCARTLWTYEQDQYQEMYDYLYEDIPGYTLSILAIILWVLTTMVEYRQVTEQALALGTLPRSKGVEAQASVVRNEDEEIEIIAIRHVQRIFALLMVSLPRLAVLVALCITGCQYLAQTASLSDIVLNALALAFVLDVDELLYQVFLPERLRGILEKVQPLPCGTKKSLINKPFFGFAIKDLMRYGVTLVLVIFAILGYLVPFYNNINGAATALCGGQHNFTFSGGTSASNQINIHSHNDWLSVCDNKAMDQYVRKYYGLAGFNSSTSTNRRTTNQDWEAEKLNAVYNYAFTGCSGDQVKDPRGQCTPIPQALKLKMPKSSQELKYPAECERFDVSRGTQACLARNGTKPKACLWSYRTLACEEDSPPPGFVHTEACSDSLFDTCNIYQTFLGLPEHPTRNCMALYYCQGAMTGCFSIEGKLRFQLANATAFEANWTGVTRSAITSGIAQLAGVGEEMVYLQNSKVVAADARRLQDVVQDYWFLIQNMPDTVKPQAVLGAGSTLAMQVNAAISQALGSNETNDTISLVSFVEPTFGASNELRQGWKIPVDSEDYQKISAVQDMLGGAAGGLVGGLGDLYGGQGGEENAPGQQPQQQGPQEQQGQGQQSQGSGQGQSQGQGQGQPQGQGQATQSPGEGVSGTTVEPEPGEATSAGLGETESGDGGEPDPPRPPP